MRRVPRRPLSGIESVRAPPVGSEEVVGPEEDHGEVASRLAMVIEVVTLHRLESGKPFGPIVFHLVHGTMDPRVEIVVNLEREKERRDRTIGVVIAPLPSRVRPERQIGRAHV